MFDPGTGARSVLFPKTERNRGYEWNFPGLVAGRETTLSYLHHRLFPEPFLSKQMFYVTKYRQIHFFFYNFTSKSGTYVVYYI